MSNEIVLQLDPTPVNPRNSEGSFVALRDGRILYAYTRFTGGGHDNSAAEIAVISSDDGGRSFGAEPTTLVPNQGTMNVMSASLLRLQDGRIALCYLVKNSHHDCRPRMVRSDDEGRTWGEPVLCIPAPGYFVVNNDRVIQLSSGRLVVPASYHRAKTEDPFAGETFDSRGIALWFLSDDSGRTWREAESWWAMPVASRSGLQEPGVVERKDGQLFSWCRTDAGYQYGMVSGDGGVTWSPPQQTQFVSPCSPLSMKRIPQDAPVGAGDLLAVWNDVSARFSLPAPAKESGGRTPLVSAVSSDDGATWTHHRLIEGDPERGYCYTAIQFANDAAGVAVLLAYCAGGKPTGGVLNTLRIRRMTVDWLYEGE